MKIAFIGLGNMGGGMAANLAKAGHDVRAFDLSETALAQAREAGCTGFSSAKEAVQGVDAVVSMLPNGQIVDKVYTDEVIGHAPQGALMIDCSTIDPHSAREVAKAAAEHGNPMLDAPVSGGTGGAAAGTLTFMVGGSDADFDRAQPILAAMGKNIVHCGAAGNGQVAKVANNMLLGISMIGVAEAMALGVALGMDAKTLTGVINTSSGRCWSSDTYNPFPGVLDNVPASRGYSGGFGSDLMLKDLGLATEAAKQVRQPVILGALAQQLYQSFSAQGHGGLDFSAIINQYRKDT